MITRSSYLPGGPVCIKLNEMFSSDFTKPADRSAKVNLMVWEPSLVLNVRKVDV